MTNRNDRNEMDFLRPSEIARRTGLSRGRVYQDIADGVLPAVKRKGRQGRKGTIHIPVEAYREYLAKEFQPI